MCSTDDDETLPISARERQVSSSASAGSVRLSVIASMTFGPPGWLTHTPIQPARGVDDPRPGDAQLLRAALTDEHHRGSAVGEQRRSHQASDVRAEGAEVQVDAQAPVGPSSKAPGSKAPAMNATVRKAPASSVHAGKDGNSRGEGHSSSGRSR